MADMTPLPDPLAELGERVLADIKRRGLTAGDRYFTTEQVGRMLGVRKATANRVMQFLADQQYLVRRQRSGTFVGVRLEPVAGEQRRVIQFLLGAERGWGVLNCDELLAGMQDVLPHASVQFNFLPARDPAGFVEKLLDEISAAPWSLALAPVSCPRDVYTAIVSRRLPAVVFGSVFQDSQSMPSIDADYEQAGRLVAEYLIAEGHQRIGLLTWQTWNPGENMFLESLNQSFGAAGMPSNSLLVRSMPSDTELYQLEVKRLLMDKRPPSALLCRNQQLAELAARVAASLHVRVPDDVAIVHEGASPTSCRDSPFPHVVRSQTLREIAATAARMLARQLAGGPPEKTHALVPVMLRQPSRRNVAVVAAATSSTAHA